MPEVALDVAIADARAMATQAGTGNHQITYLENRRQELVQQITGRHTWIEDNTGLIHHRTLLGFYRRHGRHIRRSRPPTLRLWLWLTLKLEGCEKAKVALAMTAGFLD